MVFDEDLTPEGLAEEMTLLEGQYGRAQHQIGRGAVGGEGICRRAGLLHAWRTAPSDVYTDPETPDDLRGADYYFLRSDAIAQERNRNCQLSLTNSVELRDGTIVTGGDLITPNTNNPIRRFAGGFHLFKPGPVRLGHGLCQVALLADGGLCAQFPGQIWEDNA